MHYTPYSYHAIMKRKSTNRSEVESNKKVQRSATHPASKLTAINGETAYESSIDDDDEGGFVDLEKVSLAGDSDETDHHQAMDEDTETEEAVNGNSSAEGPPGGTPKRHGASIYAIPSNAELQGLKETSELFKNNVVKLQVSQARIIECVTSSFLTIALFQFRLSRSKSCLQRSSRRIKNQNHSR